MDEFVARCKEAEVTDDNPVDANAMPLENSDGKRKLIMDKDKNITLVKADGTEEQMTIKDVAFTFGSNVVMRLTLGQTIEVFGTRMSVKR